MEIHPPAGPVHSIKDFLIHLSMIVVGILLAMSLEQLVEWRHHEHLVAEARANITSELRDNAKELEGTSKSYPETAKDLDNLLAVVKQLRTHQKLSNLSAHLDVHLSTLSMASRNSAESTGALGYMEYAEVKRLTGVYDLQQQFLRIQDRLLESATITLSGLQGDPTHLSDTELSELSNRAQTTRGNLSVAASIAQALRKEYEKALKPER